MAYETAPQVAGVIYNDDIVTTDYDDTIYESVDALLLDIKCNPSNYGITQEIVKIGCKSSPEISASNEEWSRHRYQADIVVWTVCDLDDLTPAECEAYCGGAVYDGKFWCGWHESLSIDYKTREMVTVVRKGVSA